MLLPPWYCTNLPLLSNSYKALEGQILSLNYHSLCTGGIYYAWDSGRASKHFTKDRRNRQGEDWGMETRWGVAAIGWLLGSCRWTIYNLGCKSQHLVDQAMQYFLCFMRSPCLPNMVHMPRGTRIRSSLPLQVEHRCRPTPYCFDSWCHYTHCARKTSAPYNMPPPSPPAPLLYQQPPSYLHPYPPLHSTLSLFCPHPTSLTVSYSTSSLPSSISDPLPFHFCPHPTFMPVTLLLLPFKPSLSSTSSRKSSRTQAEATKSFFWGEFWHHWAVNSMKQRFLPTLFSPVSLAPSPVPGVQEKVNRHTVFMSTSTAPCQDSGLAPFIQDSVRSKL